MRRERAGGRVGRRHKPIGVCQQVVLVESGAPRLARRRRRRRRRRRTRGRRRSVACRGNPAARAPTAVADTHQQ
jgi:hypothetical protein